MALPGVKTTILDRFTDDFSGHHMVFISKKAMQSVRRVAAVIDDSLLLKEEVIKLKENLENMDKYDMYYPDPSIYPELINGKYTLSYPDEFKEWDTHLPKEVNNV